MPGPYKPMSSYQSSGLAAMKSASSAMHSGSSRTTIRQPCSATHVVATLEVARLADDRGPDPELAQ